MNWILKSSTGLLLAANAIYLVSQRPADGYAPPAPSARVVKNSTAIAPIASSWGASPPATMAQGSSMEGERACLSLSGLSEDRKKEALALLGAMGSPRAFLVGKTWDVRFGPWPDRSFGALQELLGKWGGAKAQPCMDKEREEWEKSK